LIGVWIRIEHSKLDTDPPAKVLYGGQVNTDYKDSKYKELTEKIIGIFYKVYNNLGYGFLEKVYENAMMLDFQKENRD